VARGVVARLGGVVGVAGRIGLVRLVGWVGVSGCSSSSSLHAPRFVVLHAAEQPG